MTIESVDVVVVGAGISGLTAADQLAAEGVSVRVLEADARVGGRTWSRADAPGGPVDFGGMYIGKTHLLSRDLGLSLGLQTTPAVARGDDLYVVGGTRYRAPEGILGPEVPFLAAHRASLDALDALAARVGAEAPWDADDAADLDATTVAEWIMRTATDNVSSSLHEHAVRCVLGADPAEVSLLYWAFYVAQCEGIDTLLATRGGAQNEWWIGGAGQISARLADRLGDTVRTRSAVSTITRDGVGVVVESADGSLVRARRAIVALPPASAQRIRFVPPLQRDRRQLQMRTPMGRFSKVLIRYESPFWERSGFSGSVTDVDRTGAVVFPGTKSTETSGTLIAFIGGGAQDAFSTLAPAHRRQHLLAMLADTLGPEAAEPFYFHETDWTSHEWAQGAPVAFMPPGVLASAGAALRTPDGGVHFAGTEAATAWTGYMEGAVRAGMDAARAVAMRV